CVLQNSVLDCFASVMELPVSKVGRVREIGLDVEQDSVNHANIVGLLHREDDLAEAERKASLLAKRSHIVWRPK
ncbi:MAG: hypothetical protein ACFCUV_19745, partial [Rivularia sp. (in: cyanobacteria)]